VYAKSPVKKYVVFSKIEEDKFVNVNNIKIVVRKYIFFLGIYLFFVIGNVECYKPILISI
jgi:hypothetical protein